jgi:PAS domain S-box-containing protein
MKATARQIAAWAEKYLAKPLLIAGCFVLVALLWTVLLQHVFAYPFVFLFFGAIMGSAWFGGLIAGLWAILLSSVLIDFFFMQPLYSLTVARELRSYQEAFIVCAIAITAISVARKRSENTVRAARDELEDRVRERTAELEQSNLEILERERQLRLLTEAIPQQIWRADAAGCVEYCNHDLIQFTGKTVEELQGDKFDSIFHVSDAPIFRQSWETARRSGQQFESQLRVHGADGSYRWFLIRGIPQRMTTGEISCWYGVHIDIEEQHRAQQALLVAQGDSARWSRTLSMAEMAASIAHELKQPLTALVAQAQACRRWLRTQPMHEDKAIQAAENLVRESTRAGAVIDRVRSLFSEKDLLREPTDLNAVVRDVAQLLREESVRQGVTVHLDLAEHLPLLRVDPVQVQQLLMNLILNGMESTAHTDRTGELILRTARDTAGEVVVTVRDNGAGLTAEARERMFDPFFTTKPQGTGIGLSICRSIAEAHDGRIWAEPLEQGTAFHVVLGSGQ